MNTTTYTSDMRYRHVAKMVLFAYPLAVAVALGVLSMVYPTLLADFAWGIRHLNPAIWLPVIVVVALPIITVAVLNQLDDNAKSARGFDVTRGEK